MPPRITMARMLIDSVNRKLAGKTECCQLASSAAGNAGEAGAGGESLELGHRGVHAHGLGGELVLADGLPGPAHPGMAQAGGGQEDGEREGQEEVVVVDVGAWR